MAYDENFFKYKIESAKDKVAAELKAHPRFMELLEYACKRITGLVDAEDYGIKISEDGKSIEIIADGYNKLACDSLKASKRLSSFKISLTEDGGLITKISDGSIYRASDLNLIGEPVKDTNKLSSLTTSYEGTYYDANGIQMCQSDYTDTFELSDDIRNVNLYSYVENDTYAPDLNTIPMRFPDYCFNARSVQYYRMPNDIGVGYCTMIDGIKKQGRFGSIETKDNIHMICPQNLVHPERLSVLVAVPAATVNKNGEFVFHYPEIFGTDVESVKQNLRETFKENLERADLKKTNPEQYQALCEYMKSSRQR